MGGIIHLQAVDRLVHPKTDLVAGEASPAQDRWGLVILEFISLGTDGVEEEFIRTG